MVTNLQHTTVERHPSQQDPTRPQRPPRRTSTVLAGLVGAAVSATVLTIVVQPQADDPPQEITSPEIHRTRVPGRPQQMEIFSPEAHRAPAPTTGRPTRPPTDRQLGVPAEPSAGNNISSPTDRQLGVEATSQSPHSGPVTGRHLLAEGYYTVPSASTPADPATSTAHALHTPNELATMR